MLLLGFGLAACVAACGGGSSTPPPSGSASAATITWWQPLAPSVGAPTAIELYAQQFLDFFHADTTASTGIATTTWTTSSDAIALATPTPGPFGATGLVVAPTPTAGQTRVIYVHPGSATLTAIVPGGIATIPVVAYASVDFGCDVRASGTFPGPDATLGTAAYATLAGSTSPCSVAPGVPTSTPVTFHFPNGATLVADGNPEFRLIPASRWRDDFTTIDNATLAAALASSRVIMFKTSTGTVVKLDALQAINGADAMIGPYESTDATGQFPY